MQEFRSYLNQDLSPIMQELVIHDINKGVDTDDIKDYLWITGHMMSNKDINLTKFTPSISNLDYVFMYIRNIYLDLNYNLEEENLNIQGMFNIFTIRCKKLNIKSDEVYRGLIFKIRNAFGFYPTVLP